MSDDRKPYDEYVAEDLAAIEVRAMTLYALAEQNIPWPAAGTSLTAKFEKRAARQLWEEGALHLDPSLPYFEDAEASR